MKIKHKVPIGALERRWNKRPSPNKFKSNELKGLIQKLQRERNLLWTCWLDAESNLKDLFQYLSIKQ